MHESPTQADKADYQFQGKTGEFFGIWIVNVIFTALTLGIYSAWAKVRTYQYIYNNNIIDGHRFTYLAKPMQILKSRIIALLLSIAFALISQISPTVSIALIIGLVIAMPYLICSSLRFDLRMTSHRNVRFNFTGRYGEAALCFLVLPIVSVFTLYLLLPYSLKRMDQFIIGNISYGNKAITTNLSTKTYYKASFITFLLSLVVMAIVGVLFSGTFMTAFSPEAADPENQLALMTNLAYIYVIFILFFTGIKAYYQAKIRNHIFNQSELPDVAKFSSNIPVIKLAWLQLSNLFAFIFSLGLAIPWIVIRNLTFYVNYTQIYLLADADKVIDELTENTSALGDEVANVFDIDVSLT